MEKRVAKDKKKKRRRQHSQAFKAAAVARMRDCDNVVELGRELKVNWRLLYRWKDEAEAASAVESKTLAEGREVALREENAKLKTSLADKTLEVDFFKGALRKIEALRPKRAHAGGEAFTTKSGK
jgi:transposase-like protein